MNSDANMKLCLKCGVEKPLSFFGKHKSRSDGLRSFCKPCNNSASSEWSRKNPAKVNARNTAWRNKNKDKAKASRDKWLKSNAEVMATLVKEWSIRNVEKCRKKSKKWSSLNKDKVNARTAKRRAFRLGATPSWADPEAISDFYVAARMFRLYTGIEYHVDHVVPLISEVVCGLHVEQNLQILPASENLSKHNKYWPDMP